MADKEEEKTVLDLETFEEVKVIGNNDSDDDKDDKDDDDDSKDDDDDSKDDDDDSKDDKDDKSDSDDDKDDDDSKDDSDDKDDKSFGDIVSEKYAEKYDINSEEELEEILDDVENVLKQSEDLKTELEEAKKAPPKFKTKKEEAAFEFLQSYDVDKFGNGLGNLSRLIGMDVKGIDGKLALQEEYVLRNTELDREDALDMFNEEFEKYSVNRDDFEEEVDYTKKQKLKDIKKKQDVLKAKKFLSEQQEKIKASDEDDDSKGEKNTKVPEVSKESLGKYSKKVDSSMKGFTSLIVDAGEDGKGKEKFTYKLSKEQLKQVDLSLKAYIGNTSNYDKDGEIPDFNPDETKVNVAMALFGDKMLSEAIKYGIGVGEGKKIEDIGNKKPKRGQKPNKEDEDLSSDAQFEQQAKERKEKRDGTTQYA